MKVVNIYEAKSQLSALIAAVEQGEKVVIAKSNKPIADLVPHKPERRVPKFGTMAGELQWKDEDFMGIDPDIQRMFYGDDWDAEEQHEASA